KLCIVPSDSVYWSLDQSTRDVMDVFYTQENRYGAFLAGQPEVLEKLRQIGILDSATTKKGSRATSLLLAASRELQTKMIFAPCTYGLNHRQVELSQVFEDFSRYVNMAMERLSHYREATSGNWHLVKDEYTPGQVESLITAFQKDLAKPMERLIHFQHLLDFFSRVERIDQGQVSLARFEVDGIIRDLFIAHAYELKSVLEPLQ
ncbi:hypothetical protein HDU91_001805, partial [Kappamyces sp. JEL0680]